MSCKVKKKQDAFVHYYVELVNHEMNKLGASIEKNQSLWPLWHLFLHLRLKLSHLESNSIVARELIPLFYVQSATKIRSTTFIMWLSILHPLTKINLDWLMFYFFLLLLLHTPYALVFSKNEVDNLWIYFY